MEENGNSFETMVGTAKTIIDKLVEGGNQQTEMSEFLTVYGERGFSTLLGRLYDSSDREERTSRLSLDKLRDVESQIDTALLGLSFSQEQISRYQRLKNDYRAQGFRDV